MKTKLKPMVITAVVMMGSFCTPTVVRLVQAETHNLSELEGRATFVEEMTGANVADIKDSMSGIKLTYSAKPSGLKEEEGISELSGQVRATFNLEDWVVTETSSQILLTGYRGASQAIYIPGEHQNKQVVLKDFSILPENVVHLHLKAVNGKKVKLQTTSLYRALANKPSLKTVNLSGLDTSTITNMSNLFAYSTSIETMNLKGWNTSKVQNMSGMFKGVKQLKSLEITHFKTDNVTDFNQMFFGMEALEFLDVSTFKTTKATSLYQMFGNMFNLKAVDLSSFKTSPSANLGWMFYCSGSSSCEAPLLAIVDDPKIEDAYAKSTFNRALGANLTLDLNGGHAYGQPTFSYPATGFFLPFTDEDLEATVILCQFFTPAARENYILSGWELSGEMPTNRLERWYRQLNGPYVAKWSPVSYSTLTTSSTVISGKGVPEGKVEAYVRGTLIGETNVNSKGQYQLKIPKQKKGTEVDVVMYGMTIEPVYQTLTVLGELTNFTHTNLTPSSTTIKGKGVAGAKVGVYTSSGTRLAITTVDSQGNYQLTIPKQKVGTKLVLKQAKSGYQTLSKTLTALYELKDLTIKTIPNSSTTAIYGTGEPGANVKAFVDGQAISSLTPVNSNGNYKITIPKQVGGTAIQIKMAKSNYRTISETVNVLQDFKTFTYNKPTTSTTTIKGKGVAGAKVGVYTSSGTRLAITTVDSQGNYQLTIPKQKVGTVLTLKQAKSGYQTLAKEVTVLKEFKTFTHSTVKSSSTAITGKGVAGAKVGVYDKNGKRLAITTVNSKGNYKLTIPKQKTGTKLVLKQAKSGYLTLSKNITVVK